MFFWGPLSGPGVVKKKAWLLIVEYFSFTGLDPDGCLVADQLKVGAKTLEKPGSRESKGSVSHWMLTLQKNSIIFWDGEVFSLDRSLLMGAWTETY